MKLLALMGFAGGRDRRVLGADSRRWADPGGRNESDENGRCEDRDPPPDDNTEVPLECPKQYAGRLLLTDEEVAALNRKKLRVSARIAGPRWAPNSTSPALRLLTR